MKDNQLQFFSTREAITEWLDKYNIKNYTINDDLSVDVNGDVNISYNYLKIIPIKFGKVTASFWCQDNKIIKLTDLQKMFIVNFVVLVARRKVRIKSANVIL